jgi:amino acid transporter
VFTLYGGEVLTGIMGLLVCFSLLASYLAIHNAASRYIFALGREWLLLPWFGKANPRSGAPSRASVAVSVMTIIAVVPFALSGLDPFKAGVPVLIGFGSFGIIFLQAFAAIAILVYLRRHGGEPVWVMVATWLGTLGLIGATIFVAIYFKLLATSETTLTGLLPFVFPVIVLGCLGLGALLLLIRPKAMAIRHDMVSRADALGSPGIPAEPDREFEVRGDADRETGAWTIQYKNAAGRVITSEAKPSLEEATIHARHLRDRRGAIVLEIAPG